VPHGTKSLGLPDGEGSSQGGPHLAARGGAVGHIVPWDAFPSTRFCYSRYVARDSLISD
jgi:hypothetical protein